MPKIYAGSTQIKKIYAGSTQIKKVYAGSVKVYSADVTLTNLVSNTSYITHTHIFDAAPYSSTDDVKTFTTVSGHKYFVRAGASVSGTFTWGGTSSALIGSTTIASAGSTSNIMYTPSGTSTKAKHSYSGQVGAGAYGDAKAMFYMFVDVTPLEEALGRTFTASQFWTYIGSTPFYGSKTFEV